MKFTSFYWLEAEVERVVIDAESIRQGLEEHYELGWNVYDERRLVAGDVATEEAHQHPRLVANESWGEED